MSLIDTALNTLKEIPMADILRERLSLALDQAAHLEKQNAVLHSEKAVLHAENKMLQAELQRVRDDHAKDKEELRRIREGLVEEVRIHRTVELRRGQRTGGHWMPFCPHCHMPASDPGPNDELCCSVHCGWTADITRFNLPSHVKMSAL